MKILCERHGEFEKVYDLRHEQDIACSVIELSGTNSLYLVFQSPKGKNFYFFTIYPCLASWLGKWWDARTPKETKALVKAFPKGATVYRSSTNCEFIGITIPKKNLEVILDHFHSQLDHFGDSSLADALPLGYSPKGRSYVELSLLEISEIMRDLKHETKKSFVWEMLMNEVDKQFVFSWIQAGMPMVFEKLMWHHVALVRLARELGWPTFLNPLRLGKESGRDGEFFLPEINETINYRLEVETFWSEMEKKYPFLLDTFV